MDRSIDGLMDRAIDRWRKFSSFSTVFQSYQGDKRVIINDCLQWKPVYRRKADLESGTLDQEATLKINGP